MEIVDRQLLTQCIRTLRRVHERLMDERVGALIEGVNSAKADSLFLDVLPENTINQSLTQDYDSHLVLVTEEKGQFNFDEIARAEVVVFADPTDRSKHLKRYIERAVSQGLITSDSLLGDLLREDGQHELWNQIDHEDGRQGVFPASITGPCCAFTVVKRGEILFAVALNYVTQEVVVACRDFTGLCKISDIAQAAAGKTFTGWDPITIESPSSAINKPYVAYLGKQYEDNLRKTRFLDESFRPLTREPGGPLRILFLSNLNPTPPGFIFANGEKIGEWIHWLAYCRHSPELAAYSVFPETFFAKDGILMTPSPPYSILETSGSSLLLNFEKLRYLGNPSRYREMILVAHRSSAIRARVEAQQSRMLFPPHKR